MTGSKRNRRACVDCGHRRKDARREGSWRKRNNVKRKDGTR